MKCKIRHSHPLQRTLRVFGPGGDPTPHTEKHEMWRHENSTKKESGVTREAESLFQYCILHNLDTSGHFYMSDVKKPDFKWSHTREDKHLCGQSALHSRLTARMFQIKYQQDRVYPARLSGTWSGAQQTNSQYSTPTHWWGTDTNNFFIAKNHLCRWLESQEEQTQC